MLTRRMFARWMFGCAVAGSTVASAVEVPRKADTWITVAHGGVNTNVQQYHYDALRAMYNQLCGVFVVEPGGVQLGRLPPEIAGEVVGCRLDTLPEEDVVAVVKVTVRWFSAPPLGYFLTPYGSCDITFGDFVGKDYRIWFLDISPTSAFQRATRVA